MTLANIPQHVLTALHKARHTIETRLKASAEGSDERTQLEGAAEAYTFIVDLILAETKATAPETTEAPSES